jgi:hypothetical protein
MSEEARVPVTLASIVGRAIAGYEDLVRIGEEVEDEWAYVSDLSAAWSKRLEAEVESRGAEALAPEVVAAVDLAIEEARRISDPHRAIDWLSTFPQVVLVAMGARP